MDLSLAAIVLVLACGVSTGAEIATGTDVYRWKDGAGLVHYSDTPPASGKFTRVRLASSLTRAVDGSAPLSVGAEKARTADRVMDPSPVIGAGSDAANSMPAAQEGAALSPGNCAEARVYLQNLERRATEKPADDPRRASSHELESANQLRVTEYSRYQTARDAQLLRVRRLCSE